MLGELKKENFKLKQSIKNKSQELENFQIDL